MSGHSCFYALDFVRRDELQKFQRLLACSLTMRMTSHGVGRQMTSVQQRLQW